MKGVIFPGNRQVAFRDFADPVPGEGEVVLEIKASGMCGSDLHIYRSPGGGPELAAKLGLGGKGEAVVAGHEPCGVVVARGPGVARKHAPDGGRFMVHHYAGCETCPDCKAGWSQLCKVGPMQVYGVTGHGAHAPYIKVPAFTLVPLPAELTFEAGAAISCGTGTAWGALRRMQPDGGKTIVVLGQGPVGTSGTVLAKAMGLDVIAVDISAERLALARAVGADATIDAGKFDTVEEVRKLTGGKGAHYSLETSSNPEARAAAVRCLRTWGTACYVGEGGTLTLEVSPDMLRRQVTLMGSWTFSTHIQDDCTRFIAERGVPLDKIITDRWPMSRAEEAYTKFDKQQMGKGMLLPG
jgi:threonine dehydrogenase-like Zn-dependent dehydrogenase